MRSIQNCRRIVSAMTACFLASALALFALPAYAADAYVPEGYRVTVYAGNNGTVSLNGEPAAPSAELAPGVPLNGTADFSSLQYQVENEKYYVKGIRLAGIDNIRSDKNTDIFDADGNPVNIAGADTVLYAVPTSDGRLVNTEVRITQDTDFVVAYGILANRVSYTVNYVDTEGNVLHEPQTFFGDIGDRPAAAPLYIENYVPEASMVLLTLSEDEAKNVVTFRYARLAEGTVTVQQPSGRVDVVVPSGSTATGVYTTAPTPEEVAAADTASAALEAPDGGTGEANVPVDEATAAGANAPGASALLTTDDGTQVLDADGAPLASPGPQAINDDENALASASGEDFHQNAQAAPWWPWALAAAAVVCAMVFIVLRARKKQQNAASTQA